jgi:hypothetical protein
MRSLFLITSFVVLLGVGVPVVAQAEPQAEDVAAARALGIQGIKLADAGNCAEAIEKLERAESLYHAPSILGRLGECQVEVGRVVLGTENLNRVVREQLPPNAPAAFIAAQDRAKKVLERALPRIAYLVVRVDPPGVNPQVTIGGSPVQSALIGAERPTDAGSYEVVASAPGYRTARANVTLAEGAHQEIALGLTPDPDAQPASPAPPLPATTTAPPAVSTSEPPPAPAATSGGNRTPAYVALGIGGAGLLLGSITGIVALSKTGSLECPNNRCPPSQHSKLDSANTMATISTVGFSVGLVGAAVGTVLLLTSGKSEPAPTATVGSLHARPFIGGRTAGLEGTF